MEEYEVEKWEINCSDMKILNYFYIGFILLGYWFPNAMIDISLFSSSTGNLFCEYSWKMENDLVTEREKENQKE